MRTGGHLYAVPTTDAKTRIARWQPGAESILIVSGWGWRAILQQLLTASRISSPLFVGHLAAPPQHLPARGQIVLGHFGWVVRATDARRLLRSNAASIARAARTARLNVVKDQTLAAIAREPAPSACPGDMVFRRMVPGIGDALGVLAIATAWKRDHPEGQAHFLAFEPAAALAERHPAIHQVHTSEETLPPGARSYPLPLPPPDENERWKTSLSRTAYFAKLAGLGKVAPPRIYLGEDERAAAREWLDEHGMSGPRPVVLVWRARDKYKTYAHAERLWNRLRLSQPVVILEYEHEAPGLSTRGLTLRQTAAVMSWARLVVTGDTGPMHIAGALDVPIFGLYGSQNGALRQAEYGVPGGWMQGPCPFGRQPCVEDACTGRSGSPPCMQFPPEAAEKMILATLAVLPP